MNSWSKKKSNSSTSPKFESKPRCFHQILHMDRDIQGRKSWYSEAPWNSRSNAFKINEFQDPYKELWQEHWTLRVLKFVGTDCSAGIKWTQLSCSESILGEWGLIRKENPCTSQWSNVSVHVLFWKLKEKKFMKMRQQWDNEELKEATTMWSNDWDHGLVQEEVEGN